MKVALITGGSLGIGKSITKLLLMHNYEVVIVGRSLKSLELVKKEVFPLENRLHIVQGDINSLIIINELYNYLEKEFGKLDVLINNVGLIDFKEITKTSESSVKSQFQTNIITPIVLINRLKDLLIKSKNGHVINISSDMSYNPSNKGGVYGASKAALNYITKALALELAPFNIKVNGIAPGAVDTNMLAGISEIIDAEITTLLGEKVSPEEIAIWIYNLLCSKYVTGTIINVDGGNGI